MNTKNSQTNSLPSTSLLGGFAPETEQRFRSATNERYDHLHLGGKNGAEAQFFDDGMVTVVQGGLCVSLDDLEAMHLANAILAHSQEQSQSPYAKVAEVMQSDEARREFLDSVVEDEEYSAYLEHKGRPTAKEY